MGGILALLAGNGNKGEHTLGLESLLVLVIVVILIVILLKRV